MDIEITNIDLFAVVFLSIVIVIVIVHVIAACYRDCLKKHK